MKRHFLSGSSSSNPLDKAAPASALISTGKTAPFGNMSCTRTLPSVSDAETPAASTSSAGGADPGAFDDLSSKAMATAGASSVEMAMSVGDFLDRFRGGGFAATAGLFAGGLPDRFALAATVFEDDAFIGCLSHRN